MNLDEGASAEILARWPEYKQRNCALYSGAYADPYCSNLVAGIHLIREHHSELEAAGATTWTLPAELRATLDELAATPSRKG